MRYQRDYLQPSPRAKPFNQEHCAWSRLQLPPHSTRLKMFVIGEYCAQLGRLT